ncbi:MAG: exodeoxyribonuclease VII small subunit [Sandaracinobacteroides sp.]
MPATDDLSALSFEAALQRLETIVRQLESGDAPLEAAIGLYEEAQALRAHCEAKLGAAEARIAQLQLDPDGQPAGEVPFAGS